MALGCRAGATACNGRSRRPHARCREALVHRDDVRVEGGGRVVLVLASCRSRGARVFSGHCSLSRGGGNQSLARDATLYEPKAAHRGRQRTALGAGTGHQRHPRRGITAHRGLDALLLWMPKVWARCLVTSRSVLPDVTVI